MPAIQSKHKQPKQAKQGKQGRQTKKGKQLSDLQQKFITLFCGIGPYPQNFCEFLKCLKFSVIQSHGLVLVSAQIVSTKKGPNDAVFDQFPWIAPFIGVSAFVVFEAGVPIHWSNQPKMTGLKQAGNDDSGQQIKAVAAKIDDETVEVVATYKECGEMCSVAVVRKKDDSIVLIIGSKNVFQIVSLDELRQYVSEDDGLLNDIIIKMKTIFISLPQEVIENLAGRRLFGENVDGNHVTPLPKGMGKGYIRFFSCPGLTSRIGKRLSPIEQLKLLKALGLPVVSFEEIPKDLWDYTALCEYLRNRQCEEGSVIWIQNSDGTWSSAKFKTIWYTLMRALREKILPFWESKFLTKAQFRDLIKGVWKVYGERSVSFLHLDPDVLLAWRAKALRILWWMYSQRIPPDSAHFKSRGSFPEFLINSREPLEFDETNVSIPPFAEKVLNEVSPLLSPKSTVLAVTGRAGTGKSTLAQALAQELGPGDCVVVEHDLFKMENPNGKQANILFMQAIKNAIAEGIKYIIVPISACWKHLFGFVTNEHRVAVCAINPSDEFKDDFLLESMMDRDHFLIKGPETALAVLEDQKKKWKRSLPKEKEFHVTCVCSAVYLNSKGERLPVDDVAKEVHESVKEVLALPMNGKPLITADIATTEIDIVYQIVKNLPDSGKLSEGSTSYLHGTTLVFDPTMSSQAYLETSKLLGEKVTIRVLRIVTAAVEGGYAVGLGVSLENEEGESLDHLVVSKVPHVTISGPSGWKPSEMASLMDSGESIDISSRGITFSAFIV